MSIEFVEFAKDLALFVCFAWIMGDIVCSHRNYRDYRDKVEYYMKIEKERRDREIEEFRKQHEIPDYLKRAKEKFDEQNKGSSGSVIKEC